MSDSEHSDTNNSAQKTASATGVSDSPKTSKNDFHSDLPIYNIRNNIPIILEMEKYQYGTWAELFRIHARSH